MTETLWFDWSPEKNDINIKKHGISFHEAASVFDDKMAIVFDDPDHSDEEERFGILGMTYNQTICIVIHCTREEDEMIRIISARKATRKETAVYFNRKW